MENRVFVAAVVALCIGASAGFYGGMQYERRVVAGGQPTNAGSVAEGGRQGGRASSDPAGQRGRGANAGRRGGGGGGGNLNGQIVAKDDKSLTIKTADGASTVVYFSDSASVRKVELGSMADLVTGLRVIVTGRANADGTFTANIIQIPPKTTG